MPRVCTLARTPKSWAICSLRQPGWAYFCSSLPVAADCFCHSHHQDLDRAAVCAGRCGNSRHSCGGEHAQTYRHSLCLHSDWSRTAKAGHRESAYGGNHEFPLQHIPGVEVWGHRGGMGNTDWRRGCRDGEPFSTICRGRRPVSTSAGSIMRSALWRCRHCVALPFGFAFAVEAIWPAAGRVLVIRPWEGRLSAAPFCFSDQLSELFAQTRVLWRVGSEK